jgi:hypothetical protein
MALTRRPILPLQLTVPQVRLVVVVASWVVLRKARYRTRSLEAAVRPYCPAATGWDRVDDGGRRDTLFADRPVPDFHRRDTAVIAENAERAGIEQEMLAALGRQPDPARD